MDSFWFLSDRDMDAFQSELELPHIEDNRCQEQDRAVSPIEYPTVSSSLQTRNIHEKYVRSSRFLLAQPLKYIQRKSYEQEMRYLRPAPILRVTYDVIIYFQLIITGHRPKFSRGSGANNSGRRKLQRRGRFIDKRTTRICYRQHKSIYTKDENFGMYSRHTTMM